MDINRSNYEIWLIDLLDGNLNDPGVAALMAFLDANPDLKDEYEGLSGVLINKPQSKFPLKDLLKKSTSELTDSQFEHLCVAHLEKDIDQQQEEELNEIITGSPKRRKEFQLLQKMVLLQPQYKYPEKKSLKKNLLVRYSIPLYISLLSAAAIIAFVIYSDLLFQGNKPENSVRLAEKVMIDSFEIKAGLVVQKNIPPNEKSGTEQQSDNRKIADIYNTPDLNKDTVPDREVIRKIHLKDFFSDEFDFYNAPANKLVAFNSEGIPDKSVKERSKIGGFLAREYRNIILNDKKASDKPIDGYEIAEGGIKGLNKLLGWEMALQKNSDENGNLKSVHFDSRFIKISAPVKKARPQL